MEEALPVDVLVLGSAMISGMSRKHDSVALRSAEAKNVVVCEVGKEAVWLRKLLSNLFEKPLSPTVINCDNQSSIKILNIPCSIQGRSISTISTAILGVWYKMGL